MEWLVFEIFFSREFLTSDNGIANINKKISHIGQRHFSIFYLLSFCATPQNLGPWVPRCDQSNNLKINYLIKSYCKTPNKIK